MLFSFLFAFLFKTTSIWQPRRYLLFIWLFIYRIALLYLLLLFLLLRFFLHLYSINSKIIIWSFSLIFVWLSLELIVLVICLKNMGLCLFAHRSAIIFANYKGEILYQKYECKSALSTKDDNSQKYFMLSFTNNTF